MKLFTGLSGRFMGYLVFGYVVGKTKRVKTTKASEVKLAKQKSSKKKIKKRRTVPRCGLCGKMGNLIKTECCGQWICDDEDQYVPFSYARNSCSRNHSMQTLCGYHYNEGHPGDWKTCKKCRSDFPETEIYVDAGTNEYNFEKLEDPPGYEPTRCSKCDRIIVLSEGGYSQRGDEYSCSKCKPIKLPDFRQGQSET